MITNQQIGLRHFTWGGLAVLSLASMSALQVFEAYTGLFGLGERFYLLPYQIGVLAAFLHMGNLIARHVQRFVPAGIVEDTFLAIRITAYKAVGMAIIYVLLKDIAASRAFLVFYLLMSVPVTLVLIRVLPRIYERFFVDRKRYQRAALVGMGPMPKQLRDYVTTCQGFGIRFVGIYGEQPCPELGLPLLGTVRDAEELPDSGPKCIDHILIFSSNLMAPGLSKVIRQSLSKGLRVQAYSNVANAFEEPVKITMDGSVNLISFVDEPLLNPFNTIAKRVIDIAISLPVVLFVLPPLALIVKIFQSAQSPGPLFFRQNRYGHNRQIFQILKFRTMQASNPNESKQASVNDSRVYRFGRFLRRTSLDEFPQFLNVLRGEMSLVGPRPHLTVHDEEFEKHIHIYRSRHFVKPGITGYAQIHGLRGEISDPRQIQERVRKDVYYVTHWSVQLEITIVFRTISQIFFPPKSAY